MAKIGFLVFCQKVFDGVLGKLMTSTGQDTPWGEMSHIFRAFHPFRAYLDKVDNATFANPRNGQKWICVDPVE